MGETSARLVRLAGLLVTAKARLVLIIGGLVGLLLLGSVIFIPAVIGTTATANGCTQLGTAAGGLRVMTYNLLGAGHTQPGNMPSHVPKGERRDLRWSQRGPEAAAWIAASKPAILALQENAIDPATGARQAAVIADALPDYQWVPGVRPAQPIAYQASAGLSVAASGIIQITWSGKHGADSNRYASWVRFTAGTSAFLVFNVHAENAQTKSKATARSYGWDKLIAGIRAINTDNLPVIALGDFNANINESRGGVYRAHLVKLPAAGLVEAGVNAPSSTTTVGNLASLNGFGATIAGKFRYKAVRTSGYRIDHVWTSRSISSLGWQISTGPQQLVTRTVAGRRVPFFPGLIPSDHNPVVAQLAMGAAMPSAAAANLPAPAVSASGDTAGAIVAGYKGEQLTNAAQVVAAADKLGLDDWTAAVGIMTAMGESSLINVDYGDAAGPDSRGLFQQRSNGAWGSYSDRMNPFIAATSFFNALVKVPDYHQLTPTLAAHRTQRNADPYHYTKYWDDARQVLAWVRGNPALASVGDTQQCPGQQAQAGPVGACPASGSGAENGLQSTALHGLRCIKEAFPWISNMGGVGGRPLSVSDHPRGLAVDFMIAKWSTDAGNSRGWEVARWVQAHAAELNVKYIIWDAKSWRSYAPNKGWQPYHHPLGSSPTLMHLDHVHVSFNDPN